MNEEAIGEVRHVNH